MDDGRLSRRDVVAGAEVLRDVSLGSCVPVGERAGNKSRSSQWRSVIAFCVSAATFPLATARSWTDALDGDEALSASLLTFSTGTTFTRCERRDLVFVKEASARMNRARPVCPRRVRATSVLRAGECKEAKCAPGKLPLSAPGVTDDVLRRLLPSSFDGLDEDVSDAVGRRVVAEGGPQGEALAAAFDVLAVAAQRGDRRVRL